MTSDPGSIADQIAELTRMLRAPRARQVVAYECATCSRLFRSRTAAEDHCRILSGASPWPQPGWPSKRRS